MDNNIESNTMSEQEEKIMENMESNCNPMDSESVNEYINWVIEKIESTDNDKIKEEMKNRLDDWINKINKQMNKTRDVIYDYKRKNSKKNNTPGIDIGYCYGC